jgi:tRNA-specific 2-thiouridylase
VGDESDLYDERLGIVGLSWADEPLREPARVMVPCSAHGAPRPATFDGRATIVWDEPQRRVAPGQSVVLYDPTNTWVHGGAIATRDGAISRR